MQSIRYPQPYMVLPSQLHPSHHSHHPPPAQDSRTQLFVNNLPFRVRWQDLKDLFRKAGTVLRADVSLTPDNRSKGFGTVLFANRNDACKAVEIYNGFSWQTRILDVKLDQQDPTGALGMAAAAAATACPVPPPQQHQQYHHHHQQQHHHHQQQQQHQHQQQQHHQQQQQQQHQHQHQHHQNHHQQYQQIAAVFHQNNNTAIQPQNSVLLLPSSDGHPSSAHLHNRNGLSGTSITTSAVDSHSPAHPSSIIPTSSPNPSPAGQLPNSEPLNISTNKPVHSYQKHQHSQSLIPLSDPSLNLSKSVFNPTLRSSTHRPSRSVQLSHPHPPSQSAPSPSTSASQSPSSRPLDVHQPAFRPAGSSLNQALAHLQISSPQTIAALPSVTISSAPPESSSSASSAPVDTSSPGSSPAGSVAQHYSGGTHSKSSSLIDINSSHDGSNTHHSSLPPFQQYGPPNSYPPYNLSGPAFNHASYSIMHGQHPPSRLLFVGNLPFNLQWQDLKDLFRQAGNILRADVAATAEGRSRGFGTVLFATADDALKALEMYDGYEIKGRALKVRFDQANPLPSFGGTAVGPWSEPPVINPPNFYPIHCGQHQPNHSRIQESIQQVGEREDFSTYGSTTSAEEKRDEPQGELWAPEPVRPIVRISVPTIVPPALSPIASRRSSYFKPPNGSSEYSQTSSESGQGTSSRPGTGPEPIGHPANQPRPQTIPMPPPYAPGLVSPALPKTIQMTPSMPAFSFQPFMPATPPLLPNFFSPGIGPPPTPLYGRDGRTPPPAHVKPAHSPLGYNPMFASEQDKDDVSAIDHDRHPRAVKEEEECVDEHSSSESKTMNSNVDWGYQSASVANNRRTSLFVGRAGATQGAPTAARLVPRGGFAGRRLLGVGEDDEDGLGSECASRRASFDVSSLLNCQQASPPAKITKQRPSDILISTSDNDISKPIDHALVSLPPPPPPSDQNIKERADLVGLGFVDSIWTDKQ
ncbi:hypothetical protein MJO29_003117 [Puccinia striiformis f. sp. tritici]|nr:hypothetical protein MJO29_003117 [Puccinia striiformis f. sp. tritici]